jgi:hypothetical protein
VLLKIFYACVAVIVTTIAALIGVMVMTAREHDAAARAESRKFAAEFIERLTTATRREMPSENALPEIARGGPGIRIRWYSPGTSILMFESTSSPYARPLSAGGSMTMTTCYRAVLAIGRPVDVKKVLCD